MLLRVIYEAQSATSKPPELYDQPPTSSLGVPGYTNVLAPSSLGHVDSILRTAYGGY